MSDLISRKAAIDAIGIEYGIDASETLEGVTEVDAVEVVRCKDCKHRVYTDDGESNPDDIVCDLWETDGLTEADYCSRSERRTDAN